MTQSCMTTSCEPCTTPVRLEFSRLASVIARIRRSLCSMAQFRRNRKTLTALGALDDAALKDIGLTRGDISWAANRPSASDAATALEIVARRR